jgi:ferredoxin-thioredoxin reductase catalytic subunit
MKLMLNPDQKIVDLIRDGLKRTGGYCPCRREHTPENICMCEEFRDQVSDPAFEGFCHCRLYYKSLEETPAGYRTASAATDDLDPFRDDLA